MKVWTLISTYKFGTIMSATVVHGAEKNGTYGPTPFQMAEETDPDG